MDKIHSMHIYPMTNKLNEDGLIAIVNIVVCVPLCIRSIGVFKRNDQYSLRYPAKDSKHHYVHPVYPEDSKLIESAVIQRVKERSNLKNDLKIDGIYGTTSPTP